MGIRTVRELRDSHSPWGSEEGFSVREKNSSRTTLSNTAAISHAGLLEWKLSKMQHNVAGCAGQF